MSKKVRNSTNPTRRRGRLGFTIVELGVTLGIIAIMVAIAFPKLDNARKLGEIRSAARTVNADLVLARSLSATGTRVDLGPSNGQLVSGGVVPTTAPANHLRTRESGIQVMSATSYAVFVDNSVGTGQNTAVIYKTVDLTQFHSRGTLSIVQPIGTQIRFRNNGTRYDIAAATNITDFLTIQEGEQNHHIFVSVANGGHTRIGSIDEPYVR